MNCFKKNLLVFAVATLLIASYACSDDDDTSAPPESESESSTSDENSKDMLIGEPWTLDYHEIKVYSNGTLEDVILDDDEFYFIHFLEEGKVIGYESNESEDIDTSKFTIVAEDSIQFKNPETNFQTTIFFEVDMNELILVSEGEELGPDGEINRIIFREVFYR